MISNSIKVHGHLYQLYHDLPKYANDPTESPIIKTYDLLLKRFQGIYGRQPTYFIRSPASTEIFGSPDEVISLSTVSFCSGQNVIIAIALNGHHQIRFNHYQNALYGEKVFSNDIGSLKYGKGENEEEYSTLLTICLKAFASLNGMNEVSGLDVLIYDDFIQDEYLYSKQALCLGLYASLHAVLRSKFQLKKENLIKFFEKASSIKSDLRKYDLPLICSQMNLTVCPFKQQTHKSIAFPNDIAFVMAHSMTPLPKKLTKGKRQNLRICQVLIGIEIIKSQIGAGSNIKSLGQLRTYLDCSVAQLIDSVEEYVPKGNITSEKIQQLTEKSLIDILREVPFANNVIDENLTFNPYNRIMFSLQEQILIQKLATQNISQTLKASQENSAKLLENGSEQISQMIEVVKDLTLSWKIVGNGWGGNVLFLCKKNYADKVVDELMNEFYNNEKNKILLSDDVDQYVKVINGPGTGLCILDPQSQIWY